MKFTKKGKVLILILSLFLNLILRVPSLSHSYGADSFGIRSIANSIALFGEARYWLNPWSIGGFYPYSYASASPFVLAGTKVLTNLNVELYPLIYDITLGVLSFFTAYLLAKEIINSDFFSFIVAIVFSTSQGVLVFTTWDVTTRGLFIVLFPLFIYLLIKTVSSKSPIRFGFLTSCLFLLLAVTHKYFWYTLPIILSFIGLKVLVKIGEIKRIREWIGVFYAQRYLNYGYIILLFLALFIPWMGGLFIRGSKYSWIPSLIKVNLRYSGILSFLAVGGLVYFIFKEDKTMVQWGLALSLVGLAPTIFNITYTHFVLLIFSSLFIGISFYNLARVEQSKKRFFNAAIILLFVISITFSSFYQQYRTGTSGGRRDWYMEESTYEAGVWGRNYIPPDSVLTGNGGSRNAIAGRMRTVLEGAPVVLAGRVLGVVYGFIDESSIKVKKNSPFTTSFYQDNPFIKVEPRSSIGGLLNWMSERDADVDNSRMLKKYNVSYIIENPDLKDAMTESLHSKKDAVYSNGNVNLWLINEN